MAGDPLILKEKVDRLVTSLSNGSFTESLKSELSASLQALESLDVDRDVLQNTRIGSSLTKLSKTLEKFCKESSQKVTYIIDKWKDQLRTLPLKNPAKKQKTIDNNSSLTNMNSNMDTVYRFERNSSGPEVKFDSNLDRLNRKMSYSTPNLTSLNNNSNKEELPLLNENDFSKTNSEPNSVNSRENDLRYISNQDKTTNISNSNPNLNSSTGSLSDPGKEEDSDIPTYSGPLRSDVFRNKALNYLFRCFLLGQDFSPEIGKLNNLVYEVEQSLYDHYIVNKNSQKEYNLQLKCIAFNLKDIKNVFFNYKLYTGVITPMDLATMSSLQMASDEKKLERSEILEQSLEACQSDWAIKNIFLSEKSQGQFKCWKCNSRQTTYYQLQTRSSDEPMTTFVTCLNCKNRWRF